MIKLNYIRVLGVSLLILLAIFIISGCSGGKADPVAPQTGGSELRAPAVDDMAGNRHLWGLWQFTCNIAEGTVEITQLREADMHLNVLQYLEDGPVQLVNIASPPVFIPDAHQVHVNISLKHPFAGLDEFTGFDVRGILISHGTVEGFNNPKLSMPGEDCFRLLNADGYTRWWNPKEFLNKGYIDGRLGVLNQWYKFNATVNGYKVFADDLAFNDPMTSLVPEHRCSFGAGQINIRRYEIEYEVFGPNNPLLIFNYAVDASWEFPDKSLNDADKYDVPGDFSISSNSLEPYLVTVEEGQNTLYFNYGPGGEPVGGGAIEYFVEVYDWQGTNTIGKVWCELPGQIPYTEGTLEEDKGTSAVYRIYANAPDVSRNGEIEVLFGAESTNGGGYQGVLPGETLTAYGITHTLINNVISNVPPEACVELPEWDGLEASIYVGESIIFDASCSKDWEGPLDDFLWDFDGDGIFGEADDDSYAGPEHVATHKFINLEEPLPAVVYVDLKVVDNGGAWDTLDEDEKPKIEVWPIPGNKPPLALAHATTPTSIYQSGMVAFDALDSTDPDGTVVNFKWDFNGDGDFGDPFVYGEVSTPTARFFDIGTTYVSMMAFDDLGSSDEIDSPIAITVNAYSFDIIPDINATRVVLDHPRPNQGALPPDLVVINQSGTPYSYIVVQGATGSDPDEVYVYHLNYLLSSYKYTLGLPPNPALDWHDIKHFSVNKVGTVLSMISDNDVTFVPGEKPMYSYWNLFNSTDGHLQGSYLLSVPTRVGIDFSNGLGEDWIAGNPMYLMQVFDLKSPGTNPYNFIASRFTGNFEGSGFSIDSITVPGMMGAGKGKIDYNDPVKMRLAVDDTYFETKDFIRLYILDSAADIEIVDIKAVADPFKMLGTLDGLGGTPVDLECFNAKLDFGVAYNWIAVLVDTGDSFMVELFECYEPVGGEPFSFNLVASSMPLEGKPLALDIDDADFTIHVLSEYDGNIEATRFLVIP